MSATAESIKPTDYSRAQALFCKERGYPHFAPLSNCYSCGRDIYTHPRAQQDAAEALITSCPYCHHSFCE